MNITAAQLATYVKIREWIRDSPAHGTPLTPALRGVWTSDATGAWYVCAACLGRLTARGVRLPDQVQVWADRPEPFGVCLGCEVAS